MMYISTRNQQQKVTASQAIIQGIAPDGGLYLPEEMPVWTLNEIQSLIDMPYAARSAHVLSRFLTDFSLEELMQYTEVAYATTRFESDDVAPLQNLRDNIYVMELFHGPTCAFKDFALQLLPHLLTAALRKNGETKTVAILVATSGDTGKAALEGFADVPGTRICVFYPDGGTSPMQKRQMTTQVGENVRVAAVKGNFDDAQNAVKRMFTDAALNEAIQSRGYRFSSANSINWGRLAPQIAYYFSAYCDLVKQGAISLGDPVNFAVPTGNFGNILAAYYAKHCGLPIHRLICASNANNVLTDFLQTGVYDRRRDFYITTSPSMDILISSNLERLLRLLSGDEEKVKAWMNALKTEGVYEVGPEMLAKLRAEFDAGSVDDRRTAGEIRRIFAETHYLADPHTAVALKAYEDYRVRSTDTLTTVIDATASPFKFGASVLTALGKTVPADDFAMLDALAAISERPVPAPLAALQGREERFLDVVAPEATTAYIDQWLV